MEKLKGVWTKDLVYKAIKKGFNSNTLKGISQDKNGNVFFVSGLNKLKVTLEPKDNDTVFKARMTFPFGWSPFGWALIIPACLLFGAYFVGIVPVAILWIVSYKQEKAFNKEVFDYLSSIDISSISGFSSSKVQQQSVPSDSETNNKFKNLEQLERLARLRKEGVLTQDEFNSKKAGLLEAI